MSLAHKLTPDLDSDSHLEKLFFYCQQLSISVETLKNTIDRYERYKTQRQQLALECINDTRP